MVSNVKKHAEKSRQVNRVKETAIYTANNYTTQQLLANLGRMQKTKKSKR